METMKVIARNTTEHHGKSGLLRDVPVSRDMETAWRLAAQLALRSTRHSTVLTPTQQDRAGPKGTTTEALTALEAAAVAASVAAERAVSFAAVLDEALAVLAEAGGVHPAVLPARNPSPGAALLSRREREVLALVADGRTNKAIADILFVSPNTIKTHVASLLTKMHADSRVQLAAIAARQGLG